MSFVLEPIHILSGSFIIYVCKTVYDNKGKLIVRRIKERLGKEEEEPEFRFDKW